MGSLRGLKSYYLVNFETEGEEESQRVLFRFAQLIFVRFLSQKVVTEKNFIAFVYVIEEDDLLPIKEKIFLS